MSTLPPEVRELALRLGAKETDPPVMARFTQEGRMRQDAGARWMPFRATQTTLVHATEFAWHAAMGPRGSVRVRDTLQSGVGRLSARLFGLIPLASASGSQATRGQAMRYLAELAWCPDAVFHNFDLEWEVIAPDHLRVSAPHGSPAAAVHLHLDREGRIAAISAPDRPRSVGKAFIATPWWGRFSQFQQIDGYSIPMAGEVGWTIDGTAVTVWEGRVTDWQAVAW